MGIETVGGEKLFDLEGISKIEDCIMHMSKTSTTVTFCYILTIFCSSTCGFMWLIVQLLFWQMF